MPPKNSAKPLLYSFIASAAVLLAASCAPRNVKNQAAQPEVQTSTTTVAVSTISETNLPEANIRGEEFQTVPDLKPVFFDYDKSELKEDSRQTLKDNAAYLKGHPEIEAQIEGYCDQRGTVEYNLALGERRAKSVWSYYVHLGVPATSMATISYGKEKPFCAEMAESCWSQNRRAQTSVRKIAAAAPAAPPASPSTTP